MATIKVSTITDKAKRRLRDTSSGRIDVNNEWDALESTLEEMNNEFTFPWTARTHYLAYCDTLRHYTAPSDFKGFIVPRPENRMYNMEIVDPDEFEHRDGRGDNEMFAVDRRDREQSFLFKTGTITRYQHLHSLNQYNNNGTIVATAASDALNVKTDTEIFKYYSGSVSFDVDVSQSANDYAEVSVPDMSAVDLADHENIAKILMELYLPNATNVSSVLIRWGSSSGAYWEKSVTARADGRAFNNGWNPLAFDWETATKVGTPDAAAVNFFLFRLVYSASQADMGNVRINWLRSAPIEIVPVEYASNDLLLDASGTSRLTEIASQDDVMLFNSLNNNVKDAVIKGVTAKLFADLDGADDDRKNWEAKYEKAKNVLREMYPSRMVIPSRRVEFYVSRENEG